MNTGGRLVVYSADKGEVLLDVATGQTGNMGPPITYMLDGKQYITLLGGNPGGGGGAGPAPVDTSIVRPPPEIPGGVRMNVPVPGGAAGPGGYPTSTPPVPAAATGGAPPLPQAPPAGGRGGAAPAPRIPSRMYAYVLDGKATQ